MISKNQLKNIVALQQKKSREETGLSTAEGIKVIEDLLISKIKVKEIYATSDWLDDYSARLEKSSIAYYEVSEVELKKISNLSTPNKVLAVLEVPNYEINNASFDLGLTLYLDDIRDPGNLGTIVRTAEWFGIKQIICSENSTELFSPKAIQSSMGSLFRMPIATGNLRAIFETKINCPIYGAFMEGESIFEVNEFKNGILVIGNEANGISDTNKNLISKKISIPSAATSKGESLNAALACGIFCAEFFRRSKL